MTTQRASQLIYIYIYTHAVLRFKEERKKERGKERKEEKSKAKTKKIKKARKKDLQNANTATSILFLRAN